MRSAASPRPNSGTSLISPISFSSLLCCGRRLRDFTLRVAGDEGVYAECATGMRETAADPSVSCYYAPLSRPLIANVCVCVCSTLLWMV
jgi:hypothetical protein